MKDKSADLLEDERGCEVGKSFGWRNREGRMDEMRLLDQEVRRGRRQGRGRSNQGKLNSHI